MERYIKSSADSDCYTLAVIEIEYDVNNFFQDIFSSDEIDLATQVLSNEVVDSFEAFVDNAMATIKSYGFIVDDDKPSPRNKDNQWSYYIYFHHPEDESATRIKVEIKLKLTNHKFTKFDADGNIVLDEDRELNHLREGMRIDRDNLEAKLRKAVVRIEPSKIIVEDESVISLYKGLDELESILENLLETAEQ